MFMAICADPLLHIVLHEVVQNMFAPLMYVQSPMCRSTIAHGSAQSCAESVNATLVFSKPRLQ